MALINAPDTLTRAAPRAAAEAGGAHGKGPRDTSV